MTYTASGSRKWRGYWDAEAVPSLPLACARTTPVPTRGSRGGWANTGGGGATERCRPHAGAWLYPPTDSARCVSSAFREDCLQGFRAYREAGVRDLPPPGLFRVAKIPTHIERNTSADTMAEYASVGAHPPRRSWRISPTLDYTSRKWVPVGADPVMC